MKRLEALTLALALLAMPSGSLLGSPISWTELQGPAVGARAVGLSGCFATAFDEPSLVYWNPAGLSIMPTPALTVSYLHSSGLLHDPIFSGPKRLNYIAYATEGVGLAWRSLARYQERQLLGAGADSTFRYLKYGADEFTLAMAQSDPEMQRWSMGLSAKFIWGRATEVDQHDSAGAWGVATILDDNGYGYGLDLGFQFRHQALRLGASAQNLLAKVYWREFDDDRPKPHLVGSLSWHGKQNLVLSAGGEKYLGSGTPRLRYSAAGEYKHPLEGMGAVTFRGGYSQTYQGPADGYSWSAGLGYFYKRFLVDAAGVKRLDPASGSWRWSYLASVTLFTE